MFPGDLHAPYRGFRAGASKGGVAHRPPALYYFPPGLLSPVDTNATPVDD